MNISHKDRKTWLEAAKLTTTTYRKTSQGIPLMLSERILVLFDALDAATARADEADKKLQEIEDWGKGLIHTLDIRDGQTVVGATHEAVKKAEAERDVLAEMLELHAMTAQCGPFEKEYGLICRRYGSENRRGQAVIEGAKGRIRGIDIGEYWDDARREGWRLMNQALREAK